MTGSTYRNMTGSTSHRNMTGSTSHRNMTGSTSHRNMTGSIGLGTGGYIFLTGRGPVNRDL